MGSRTFYDMAVYWPSSTEPFAAPMNEIPKVVFSRKGALEPPRQELTTTALADATRVRGAGSKPSADLSPSAASWAEARAGAVAHVYRPAPGVGGMGK